MVVFDTSFLALAFDGDFKIPLDPVTKEPLTQCAQRINHLIRTLSAAKQRILIPTPVLAEYLVEGGQDKDKRLQAFTNSRAFSIAPFDRIFDRSLRSTRHSRMRDDRRWRFKEK